MIGDEVKSSHQFSKYTFIYWLQDNLIIEKKQLTKIYDQSIHFTSRKTNDKCQFWPHISTIFHSSYIEVFFSWQKKYFLSHCVICLHSMTIKYNVGSRFKEKLLGKKHCYEKIFKWWESKTLCHISELWAFGSNRENNPQDICAK